MIQLYGGSDEIDVACVMWTIAELDLEFGRVDPERAFKGADDPDYRRMSPAGQAPCLALRDGATLWRSNAIIRYLCTAYAVGALIPVDAYQRAHVEAWMDWSHDFADAVLILREALRPEATSGALDAALERAVPAFNVLNTRLRGRNYVMGDEITAADFALGAWAHMLWLCPRKALPSGFEAIWDWTRRLQSRPAYQAHVVDKLTH